MGYIGQKPLTGAYSKIDSIASQFDGVLVTFNTLVGAVAVVPGTARHLIVSLGGVIQEPDTDYTVSGSTITFTTAPNSGTTFFAILLGHTYSIGTPSDGTVDAGKLAADAVETAKILDANVTSEKLKCTVAFRAYQATATAMGGGANTVMDLGTEVFDEGADFASNAFTAPYDGIYPFAGQVECSLVPVANWFGARISVNSVSVAEDIQEVFAANKRQTRKVAITLKLLAGDVVRLHGYINGGGSYNSTAGIGTYFSGYLSGRT